MPNKEKLENQIIQELLIKAREVEPSEEMFSRIIRRIETDDGGKRSMLMDRISVFKTKRWIAVTVCSLIILMGVMFTFSEDVRAATFEAMNTIKAIFVVDKSETGEYAIIEKTTEDVLFSPSLSSTTYLSDEELSTKMGFQVHFPEKLNDEFNLDERAEGVGINIKISEEAALQLEPIQLSAINDETAFESLAEYKPNRFVFAIYTGQRDALISISMQAAEFPYDYGNNSTSIETTVDGQKALWIETIRANYAHTTVNGIGKADLYTKPDKILKKYSLTWSSDGIVYHLGALYDFTLTMEEAVQLAEAFMAAQ